MRREIVQLTMGAFCAWLREKSPPSVSSSIDWVDGAMSALVGTLPDPDVPDLTTDGEVSPDSICLGLAWLFTRLREAHKGDHWCALATQALQMLLPFAARDILTRLSRPDSFSGRESVKGVTHE